MNGGPNIIKLLDTCIDEMTKTPALVFEYLSNNNLKQVLKILKEEDIKMYMY